MHIIISGKHLEVGESLKNHTSTFLTKNIKKYFDDAINAHVTISKQTNTFHTHITVNDGTGVHCLVNGDSSDQDAYKSVDKAIKKIEKQLEKYKNRIKNHHKIKASSIEATKYVVDELNNISQDEEEHIHIPTTIAQKQLTVSIMSVKDAIMHIDLQNLPALMFINSSNYKLNMVYRRSDNNIAWVDTNVDMTSHTVE